MSEPTQSYEKEARRLAWVWAKPGYENLAVQDIAQAILAAEERGVKRGLERAAEIARNEGPATQDMVSTMICDALDDVARLILSEITPSPAASSQRATAGSSDTSTGDPAPIHDEASK